MISSLGLIGALALLIYFTIRGMNLLIAAPLTAMIIAVTGGLSLMPSGGESNDFIHSYMNGFTGFIASWFFMFLLGALFGKLMEDTGCADSIARWIVSKLGMHNAALAVIAVCAILTYGGVSVFVVAFSAYSIALSLFKQADLPRRFIPAVMAFGSVTFTMTSAGSPEIQNWIPIKYLGTSPYAGWQVSAVVAVFKYRCRCRVWLSSQNVTCIRECCGLFDNDSGQRITRSSRSSISDCSNDRFSVWWTIHCLTSTCSALYRLRSKPRCSAPCGCYFIRGTRFTAAKWIRCNNNTVYLWGNPPRCLRSYGRLNRYYPTDRNRHRDTAISVVWVRTSLFQVWHFGGVNLHHLLTIFCYPNLILNLRKSICDSFIYIICLIIQIDK